MAPPAPPRAVDSRFTASRAHRKAPVTLVAKMRPMRAASIESTRVCVSRTPALFTSARSEPSTLVDRLEEPEDVGLDADVGADGDGRAAARFDVGDHGIGRRAIRSIVDADGVAALGRQAGGRGANATAAARHQDRH